MDRKKVSQMWTENVRYGLHIGKGLQTKNESDMVCRQRIVRSGLQTKNESDMDCR